MRIRALAWGLLLAAAPAFAADVDGKWTGSVDTPSGPATVEFNFKADGAKLTGTNVGGPDHTAIPLKNGKIDGSNITFAVELDFGAGPTTFNYTGVLAGKEIKLHTDFMGQPIDFTVKKAD